MHQTELIIIGVSAGLALGLLIAYLVFLGFRWYKNRAHLSRCANGRSMTTLPMRVHGIGVSTNFSASLSISTVGADSNIVQKSSPFMWRRNQKKEWLASGSGIPTYNYRDIQKATQNFTTILGQGSFGPVYKAVLVTGETVAVKILASDSRQGEREFQAEVSLLGRLHHRNLVNLVGYCIDKGHHILIYEFMSNGSLANRLYSKKEPTFSWDERIQIALDIAHGIEYLHEGAVPPVIHRDLKSANILLDQSMRAKVADFGLSKEEEFDGRNSGLKGTYGYIDPEYICTNKFTTKSDIYSFGVILFELITAIHPHQNLIEYINLASMSPEGVDEILDEQLAGECSPDEVRQLADIAQKCLRRLPRRRPSIGEVSQALIKIKQRRLLSEDPGSFTSRDLSRVASMIEDRQVELSNMTSAKEYNL